MESIRVAVLAQDPGLIQAPINGDIEALIYLLSDDDLNALPDTLLLMFALAE